MAGRRAYPRYQPASLRAGAHLDSWLHKSVCGWRKNNYTSSFNAFKMKAKPDDRQDWIL